jgi:hypothetical protein
MASKRLISHGRLGGFLLDGAIRAIAFLFFNSTVCKVDQWDGGYVRSNASMVRIWVLYNTLGSRKEKLWALCGCGSSRGELGTNQSPQLSENSRADGHFLASPVWGTWECCVQSWRRILRIGLQLLALHTACHTTSSWSLSNGAASDEARSERMRCRALHLLQASRLHCSIDSSTTVASPLRRNMTYHTERPLKSDREYAQFNRSTLSQTSYSSYHLSSEFGELQ